VPPDLIAGRYRIEREVGRGGMGMVWLCRDERLDRDVAVKQVGGLPGESSMHLARALREARHSAALNHPNVVAIFDAIEDGNVVWLIMEYVPSRTLSQIIRSEGALPAARAARIGAQVADGLAAAHARGTIHRDVKPSNILVADGDLAKISDFGIARAMDEEQLTRSGLVMGTPSYFSPEQARGEEPTPASDVWALGATIYAAVEGRPLYPEQSNAIAMLRVIAEADPPPAERAGPLHPALERMLDPDPSTRWSMAQAARALRDLGDGALPEEEPTRPLETAPRPPTSRTPLPAPAPVAAAPPEQAPEDTVRRSVATDDRPGRHSLAALVAALVVLLVAAAAGGYYLIRDPSSPTADPQAAQTPDERPSRTGSTSPSPTESEPPSPETTADPPDPTPEPAEQEVGGDEPQGTDDPATFVAEYYSYLPDDTETSWQMLSPQLQNEVGRGSYEGFWASVSDVRVDDVTADGDGAVLVTLTYTTARGTEQETRRLLVSEAGGGLLISDDQGAV
jgi:eukaryotic-like serine/threonine-protein kinase